MAAEGKKFSIYLPQEVLDEAHAEADRTGKSMSRLMRDAWELSKDRIKAQAVPPPVKGDP